MTKVHSTDPRRGFDLLWGHREDVRPGRRRTLSAREIARAGIELADVGGVEKLSMRRIADSIGCGAMSIYRHVPGKAELIDLMLDTVMGDEGLADLRADGWRACLKEYAATNRAIYERHPWILQVQSSVRPTLGPNCLDAYERLLTILSTSGLDTMQIPVTASLLDAYVHGAVGRQIDLVLAERSGESIEAWWSDREMFWVEYFSRDRYPMITRSYEADAFDHPEDDFAFGLERVLDGIQALLAQSE